MMRLLLVSLLAGTALAQQPPPEIAPRPAVPASTPLPVSTPIPIATPTPKPALRPPPPEPEPSPTPTIAEKVDGLSADDVQAVLDLLPKNYLQPGTLTAEARALAEVQGLLQRLGPGVALREAPATAPEPSPFRSSTIGDRIGYLRLGALTGEHLAEIDTALTGFASEKIRSLILDLRATPESSDFALAADLIKRFVPKGKLLFQIKKPGGAQDRIFTSNADPRFRGILVVLVDGQTAGAPEVAAAVLRIYARALIVGQQTTGQAVEYADLALPSGKILRVATAEVTLPENAFIFPKGVKPDLALEVPPAETRRLLRAELEKDVTTFILEKERPRMNEASLVAGTNPELDAYAREHGGEVGPKGVPAVLDTALQRAVDLITSIGIFDRKSGVEK